MLEAVAQPWLALHCQTLPGVRSGIVWLGDGSRDGRREIVAHWPQEDPQSTLSRAAEAAISDGRPTVRALRGVGPTPMSQIAVPFGSGELRGAVAVEIAHAGGWDSEPSCKSIVDALMGASAWLERLTRDSRQRERLGRVLEVVSAGLELEDVDRCATAMAAELATQLECERVAVGLIERRQLRVRALSTSASFDARSQTIEDIERAMSEAADQDRSLVRPAASDDQAPGVALAAEALLRSQSAGSVCSVPLPCRGKAIGAITLEHARPDVFDAEAIAFVEGAALLAGPLLDLERRAAESVSARIGGQLRAGLTSLRSPGHSGRKLIAVALAATTLVLCFASGTYRVRADATLEGRMQRAIVAGFEGFIAEEMARAGDVVKAGQLLARLDSKDLGLEQRQWDGRRAQFVREYREAVSAHDRGRASVLQAQIDQAEAQGALVEEKIARSQLRAPFDGVIVRGDLSQSLGTPVERGDLLFEIAPLDGYRVILAVDERDISNVHIGQAGQLTLSALPDHPLPLSVERIIPISIDHEGRNAFRVESRLDAPVNGLRPGMEGVGKIEIEERRWAWIWTHELLGWLRVDVVVVALAESCGAGRR